MEYVDSKDRTFETRLKFIREIFTNRFAQHEILASSVNHKLWTTFENAQIELNQSSQILQQKNPLKVLKKENKEN